MSNSGSKKYFYGLEDRQIDLYVKSLGFRSCINNIAKFCVGHNNKRFLYISSGQFGMKIGKGKRKVWPDEKYWNALREQCNLAQVLFIMVGYENCQPLTVIGRKRTFREPIPTSLPDWYDHSGLIVVERNDAGEWKTMRYFDCQLFTGEPLAGHFAYDSVTKFLRPKIEEVLLLGKTKIRTDMFSKPVEIENACTAPLLFVIEAMVKGNDANPYKSAKSMPNFLDKVCQYLEGLGHTNIRGSVSYKETQN